MPVPDRTSAARADQHCSFPCPATLSSGAGQSAASGYLQQSRAAGSAVARCWFGTIPEVQAVVGPAAATLLLPFPSRSQEPRLRPGRDSCFWANATVAPRLLDRRFRASTITSYPGKEPYRASARLSITGCRFAKGSGHVMDADGDAAAADENDSSLVLAREVGGGQLCLSSGCDSVELGGQLFCSGARRLQRSLQARRRAESRFPRKPGRAALPLVSQQSRVRNEANRVVDAALLSRESRALELIPFGHRRSTTTRVSRLATRKSFRREVRGPCLLIRRWGCQGLHGSDGAVRGLVGCGSFARGRPGLLRSAALELWWAGDEMFDGVIPLGEALRPLNLSRRSTRVACRQQGFGSRPRRIGVSEGLPRAKVWMFVFGSSGLAGTRCHTAQPKPGSSGEGICALGGCRRFGGGWAAA